MTIRCKLCAKKLDINGYINYIFCNLESNDKLTRYVMCTQYPNWNQEDIQLNDIGFLTYEIHYAGKDTYYDGEDHKYYRYDGIQLIRFIKENIKHNNKIIL